MALKTTIAAAFAALTMFLFAGTAAEAKTRVVIGIGNVGWGVHSCWGGYRRHCGWGGPRYGSYRSHYGHYRYAPRNRITVYTHGGKGGRTISCGAASNIVDRNGYSGVRASNCRGDVYSFNAKRNGKFYRVRVNSHTGRIIGSGRL